MKNEIPDSLKNATTAYVAELSCHPILIRLRILTAVLAGEIASEESFVRDFLVAHVIVGLLSILRRMGLLTSLVEKKVESLARDSSSAGFLRNFLN